MQRTSTDSAESFGSMFRILNTWSIMMILYRLSAHYEALVRVFG